MKPHELKLGLHGQTMILDDSDGLLFMLNFMIATLRYRLTKRMKEKLPFIEADDFLDAFDTYPPSVIAENRRQRAYISNLLSRNEVNSNYKCNALVFVRVSKGQYLLNPLVEIEISEGEWVNVYELAGLTELSESSHQIYCQLAKLIHHARLVEQSLGYRRIAFG